jgi:predicted MFS family arabinose efflux permease
MGCVFPFIMPARQAIVANLVGRSGLASAIAINMTGMNVTRVVGPALGGFLVAGIGIEPTYGLGVVLYALALVLLLQIRPSHPDLSGPQRSVRASLVEGIHYMREQPLVLALLLFGLIRCSQVMPFQ